MSTVACLSKKLEFVAIASAGLNYRSCLPKKLEFVAIASAVTAVHRDCLLSLVSNVVWSADPRYRLLYLGVKLLPLTFCNGQRQVIIILNEEVGDKSKVSDIICDT